MGGRIKCVFLPCVPTRGQDHVPGPGVSPAARGSRGWRGLSRLPSERPPPPVRLWPGPDPGLVAVPPQINTCTPELEPGCMLRDRN